MIITLSIPEDAHDPHVTVIAREGELAAVNTLPLADFAELIEAATNMLAELIAHPPDIPAPPPPPTYIHAKQIDWNEAADKLLPAICEAITGWNFAQSKITVKNMAARLQAPTEKVVEMALNKLAEQGRLKALKYGQFGPPDSPSPSEPFEVLENSEERPNTESDKPELEITE